MSTVLASAMGAARERTSHAKVVAELGRDIVAGRMREGSILPGDGEMTRRFAVSRTVLREAMKTLAAKRLVEPKAKVGTRVLPRATWNLLDPQILAWHFEAGLNEAFITDLADMRMALEPAAAAMAARQSSAEEILALYAIVERFEHPSHTPESFARVDLEFHLAIVTASRNPFMRSVAGLIEAALAVSFRLSSPASSPDLLRECAANHLRIVRAVAARDEEAARRAMTAVITSGAQRTRAALAS